MPTEDAIEDDLTVPLLSMPEFKAQIPDHLLDGLTKREHHTLVTLDVMAQQTDWLCHEVIAQNVQLRRMEKEIIRLRRFRDTLTSKWAIVSAIGIYIAPTIVPKLIAMMK